MNKNSITDYFGYILLKTFGPLFRVLPLEAALFIGRRIGDLIYAIDRRHRAIVYTNLRTALFTQPQEYDLKNLTKQFYRNFGQNIIDIFLIPRVDKQYLAKYTTLEGREYIDEAFKRGKGVIFVGMHEGSWEFYNIYCANLGIPFFLFVRDQKFPRINRLLNQYRIQKGCQIVKREKQTRQLIEVLKNNQAMGMSLDQGGRAGALVDFFGKRASMATGAIRLALKYDVAIIPSFFVRSRGPHVKIILDPVFKVRRIGGLEFDVQDNLRRLVEVFQKNIRKYPQEYFWSYKIWKYSDQRNILILDDGKAGHLRQAESVAKSASAYFRAKGINTQVEIIQAKIRNKIAKPLLILSSLLGGKYSCQGCTACLKYLLESSSYRLLMQQKPDMIISCGSATVPVNFVLSRENLAKSIVVMRPSVLSARKFDLVIMPKHDKPAKKKNVLAIEGALNLIDDKYLEEQADKLLEEQGLRDIGKHFCIGLLIGGDTKEFKLKTDVIFNVIRQIKYVSGKYNADVLITTSRRTPPEAEDLIKREFKDFAAAKLVIIANQKNSAYAVGGILGLSSFVITSPESISMITESVDSRKYTIVFKADGISQKHSNFISDFSAKKYIYLSEPENVGRVVEYLWMSKPAAQRTANDSLVAEAIGRIL